MSTDQGRSFYVGVFDPTITSVTGSLNSGSYPDTAHGTYANTASFTPSVEDRDRGNSFFRLTLVSGSLPTPVAAGATITYRMTGYYAAGAVWEVWTASAPNTSPPSLHTLLFITYMVIAGSGN